MSFGSNPFTSGGGGGGRIRAELVGKMDITKLIAAKDRKERKVLYKTAAYARKTISHSIRKKKKTSDPGKPPASHAGQLRKMIAFEVDVNAGTAAVGAIPFSSQPDWLPGSIASVPELLEKGGTVTRTVGKRKPKSERHVYRPRPFIDPAVEETAKRMAELMETIDFS